MATWQSFLERWHAAGLLDAATADRVRAWERTHGEATRRDRLAQIAFGLGGLLLAAGVLLFVAAHWDDLSPALRFALVLLMIALFHGAAAATRARSVALATTLHAVGTAAFGAGVYLAGQIFNMAEHWPGALMLWALGATCALALLRDWPHVLWVAVLVPAWLVGEWIEVHESHYAPWLDAPAAAGCMLLALVYLSARSPGGEATWRTALARLGAVALIPAAIWLGAAAAGPDDYFRTIAGFTPPETQWTVLGWAVALVLPAVAAFFLRGRDALYLAPALLWVGALVGLSSRSDSGELLLHALFALGAIGVVLWGGEGSAATHGQRRRARLRAQRPLLLLLEHLRQARPIARPHRHGRDLHRRRLVARADAAPAHRTHQQERRVTAISKSLLVALIQVAIVGLLGAKFLVDRATYPRVWVATAPVDPDLPIRGRYLQLSAVVEPDPRPPESEAGDPWRRVRLDARDDKLVAIADPDGRHHIRKANCGDRTCWVLAEALAYFIPEHVKDPSIRGQGEELWVEITLPPKGPPRPVRLGVKTAGELQPLEIR